MELRAFVVAMAICGPPKSEFVYECLNCALVDLLTYANTLNILIKYLDLTSSFDL